MVRESPSGSLTRNREFVCLGCRRYLWTSFEGFRDYYNEEAYRFEIPAEEFDTVRDELADEYINLVVVGDLDHTAW